MDESANNSFADLPCELTITEDNRAAIGNDLRFNMANMATFEASKKLLRETQDHGVPEAPLESIDDLPLEQNSLLRKLEIFEGEG